MNNLLNADSIKNYFDDLYQHSREGLYFCYKQFIVRQIYGENGMIPNQIYLPVDNEGTASLDLEYDDLNRTMNAFINRLGANESLKVAKQFANDLKQQGWNINSTYYEDGELVVESNWR